LEIITADAAVKAILFNIFGGITRGDDVANGIVQATAQLSLQVPLVIRLTGTNEAEALAILTRAGFSALTDMDEAVQRAVALAADAGVGLIICITEGIPVLDMTRVTPFLHERGARLIGPNCPGLIAPGKSKIGIIPGNICKPGRIGVVSRSGTLTYEIIHQLSGHAFGQSTCVGIGGDPLVATSFIQCLSAFQADAETDAVVLIGEIGGTDEQQAAEFVQRA